MAGARITFNIDWAGTRHDVALDDETGNVLVRNE